MSKSLHSHKMHCVANDPQKQTESETRRRHHAKNATDRQQTNRRKGRRRTESNPYSWWTTAACGRAVRNNHPVERPMWRKRRERERGREQGFPPLGWLAVKGNMWLILPPQTSEKLQVARGVKRDVGIPYIIYKSQYRHESKCSSYIFMVCVEGIWFEFCVCVAEAAFNQSLSLAFDFIIHSIVLLKFYLYCVEIILSAGGYSFSQNFHIKFVCK